MSGAFDCSAGNFCAIFWVQEIVCYRFVEAVGGIFCRDFMSMALLGTGREKGVDVDFFKGVLKALMYVRVDIG